MKRIELVSLLLLTGCPGVVSSPALSGHSQLRVASEALALECVEASDGDPECTFETASVIENPTAEPISELILVHTEKTGTVAIAREGVVRAESRSSTVTAFIEVEPQATVRVTASGTVWPGHIQETIHALHLRHVFLASEHFDSTYVLRHVLTATAARRSDHFYQAQVDLPADWRVTASFAKRSTATTEVPKGQTIFATAGSHRLQVADEMLDLWIEVPGWLLHHGGPVLGAGIGLLRGASVKAYGVFGYELAIPDFLIVGAAVDTDFTDRLTTALVLELTTPYVLDLGFLPSFGIGAGPAVQLLPDSEAGVRYQLTLAYPLAGISLCADRFSDRTAFYLFLRASL